MSETRSESGYPMEKKQNTGPDSKHQNFSIFQSNTVEVVEINPIPEM